MAKKRATRSDSRAHTPCPICVRRVHGARGLKMHLVQVHEFTPDAAEARIKLGAR